MKLIYLVLSVALIVGFALLLINGVDKKHSYECVRWNDEMQEFEGYYLTEWQKEQCEYYGWEF